MKIFVRLAFAAAFVLCCLAPVAAQVFPKPEGEILSEHDRFTDKTTMWLMQLQVAEKQFDFDYQRLYISIWTQFDSALPTRKPEFVGVNYTSWSLWDNRFTGPQPVDAIIDGERWSYGIASPLSRRVINGKHVVNLLKQMPYIDFLRLITARSVEMRVGDVEFTLDAHAFKMLRDFNARITP